MNLMWTRRCAAAAQFVAGVVQQYSLGAVLVPLIVIEFLLIGTAPARPTAPDAEAEYSSFRRIRTPQLVLTEQATVHDLTLPLPDIVLRFERGTIVRVAPVDGRTTGFYFVGNGSAEFAPSDSGEARHLDRQTRGYGGRERYSFERLYCRFPDWDQLAFSRTPAFVPMLGLKSQGMAVRDPDRWLLQRLAACQDDARQSLRHPHVELFEEVRTGHRPGSFYAVYSSGEPGADAGRFYCFQPRDVEPIAYNGWVRYCPAKSESTVAAQDFPVEPLWYDLATTIDSSGHFDVQVESRLLVTAPALVRIFLDFAPIFEVREVTDERKQPLKFWREPTTSGPQGILIFLPRQRIQGDTVILRFAYSGSPAIAAEGGTFYLPRGLRWFPTVPCPAKAAFDARFTCPLSMSVIASGRKIREQETAQGRRSFWVSSGGIPDFTFAFGNYGVKDYFYKGVPPVTAFTPRLLKGPAAADSLREVIGDVLNSLSYYQKTFGPYPFENFAVGEVPAAQHGIFAGLIYLPHRAFESAGAGAPQTDCGHGVAGQWWSYVLHPSTYRERWLIEGLAEYSSLLYLEKSRKRKDLASAVVRSWRDEVRVECDVPAAGPLILGGRLPERFLLAKGACVLHMLRMMMADLDIGSDRRFMAMLRDFLEYYRGREVTTQDFQHQAELYYGESLDWFFRQWVYGTDIPSYAVRYEVAQQPDGKYWVRLEVEQTGVSGEFKMPVPITVKFDRGRPCRGRVWISGAATTAQLGPFEYRPLGLVFNDFDAVLTRRVEAIERIAETETPR